MEPKQTKKGTTYQDLPGSKKMKMILDVCCGSYPEQKIATFQFHFSKRRPFWSPEVTCQHLRSLERNHLKNVSQIGNHFPRSLQPPTSFSTTTTTTRHLLVVLVLVCVPYTTQLSKKPGQPAVDRLRGLLKTAEFVYKYCQIEYWVYLHTSTFQSGCQINPKGWFIDTP